MLDMVDPIGQQNNHDSVSLIFGEIQGKLKQQSIIKVTYDNKAQALIGFGAGMFALMMTARETLIKLSLLDRVLILVSIFFLALSVIVATIINWVRIYYSDPNPLALANNYLAIPEYKTKLQLIANMCEAWKKNQYQLNRISILVKGGQIAQLFGFVIFGSALFLSVIGI